ncbi:hypothetical protein [Okeania sp. SIO1I7]|uniref:hypothetical protein n=1 Tax=Okeania sp. SIO1I7 TaxID=2607772 RepID=UPI0013FCB358|nr:hypothetical protein [Okeania sp. SIO1I7]NET30315.1 hypothetical protein [Okeania sp. SIO1I7]
MSKASKIRSTKINKVSASPDVKNRNKTSNPKGLAAEKNAIADNIKSLVNSYNFTRKMDEFNQEMVVASAIGTYGKDAHLLSKQFNSGYESVAGIDKKAGYDNPNIQRISEGVVIEQNLESGKIKTIKDKNYYKD